MHFGLWAYGSLTVSCTTIISYPTTKATNDKKRANHQKKHPSMELSVLVEA